MLTRKMRKALWLQVLRTAGAFKPALGTRLAIRFYGSQGMIFEGVPTYVAWDVWFDSTRNYSLITLSEGSTVSAGVRVLTHDWSPSRVLWSLGRSVTRTPVGRCDPVIVKPFAFIGMGSILMPGCTIGRGAIIGAGSVVRGTIPDYAIAVGNPVQIIGDSREYVQRKFPAEWAELPPRGKAESS